MLGGQIPQFQSNFQSTYRCYSVGYLQKPDLEGGGKIILPASALDTLARLRIEYPMLFELSSPVLNAKRTHCGVLEFTAPEGTCGIPFWMMQLLLIDEGGFISVRSAALQKGTYVKVQPHSTSFIDIANPKAVLENRLRNFAALTQGDVIKIEYNKKNYYLSIVEVKPASAVSIIETDLQLDFAPPLDYKEPTSATTTPTSPMEIGGKVDKAQKSEAKSAEKESEADLKGFRAFSGNGYTLKSAKGSSLSSTPPTVVGKATPKSTFEDSGSSSEEEEKKDFKPFSGQGFKLHNK